LYFKAQISYYMFSRDVPLSQLTFSGILPDFSTVKFKESGIHIVHVYKVHLFQQKICCTDYFSLKN